MPLIMSKSKKTLYERLTERYFLVIRNEENMQETTVAGLSNGRVLLLVSSLLVFLFFLCLTLAQTLLERWYDPRFAQLEANKRLLELAVQVDSLAIEVDRKDKFILNIQRILSGDTSSVASPDRKSTRLNSSHT